VFAFAPFLAATGFGQCIAPFQFGQLLLQIHAADYMLP
jgi:hypothetical protein